MAAPGEYKTVQSRILQYAQEIGWAYVSRPEAEKRRGFDPSGTTPEERAHKASLFFGDLLHAQVRAFNPTNGNLNFNAELLALDRDAGEYVIVHELLHFVVPHHGKLWKSLMRAYLGDYERLDAKLKARAARTSPGLTKNQATLYRG
jgi:hypothetical protein